MLRVQQWGPLLEHKQEKQRLSIHNCTCYVLIGTMLISLGSPRVVEIGMNLVCTLKDKHQLEHKHKKGWKWCNLLHVMNVRLEKDTISFLEAFSNENTITANACANRLVKSIFFMFAHKFHSFDTIIWRGRADG